MTSVFGVAGLVLNVAVVYYVAVLQMIKNVWSNNFVPTCEGYSSDGNVRMPSARISF